MFSHYYFIITTSLFKFDFNFDLLDINLSLYYYLLKQDKVQNWEHILAHFKDV